MKMIEKFREDHPEGQELWCWYSGYDEPYWQFGAWVNLDRWGFGVETEVDPGGFWKDSEHRRFFSVDLGPLSLVLTRVKRSKYAPTA